MRKALLALVLIIPAIQAITTTIAMAEDQRRQRPVSLHSRMRRIGRIQIQPMPAAT